MKVSLLKITLTAVFCLSLFLSCSSDIELPLPPVTDSSSSGVVPSSSSGTFSGSSSSSSSITTSCPAYNSTTHFCDTRDGTVYKYEVAPPARGGGHWMSENLNFSNNGTIGYCYGTGTALGTVGANLSGCNSPYGRNYTYSEAMAGNSPRGVCPSGWHIPSAAEWQTIGAVQSTTASGTRNMSVGFYVYSGNYNTNGTWPPLGWKERGTGTSSNGFYWTSNANNYFIFMGSYEFQIRTDAHSHGGAEYFSVRCLKDGTGSSLPTCQYQPNWCGGTSLANVKFDVPGSCIFIKGITANYTITWTSVVYVNGNAVTSFDNSYPKIDGGYYIYAGSGYTFNSLLPQMITNTPPDCNVNAN